MIVECYTGEWMDGWVGEGWVMRLSLVEWVGVAVFFREHGRYHYIPPTNPHQPIPTASSVICWRINNSASRTNIAICSRVYVLKVMPPPFPSSLVEVFTVTATTIVCYLLRCCLMERITPHPLTHPPITLYK